MVFRKRVLGLGLSLVEERQVQVALEAMGPNVEKAVPRDDFRALSRMVSHLVRNIRDLSVEVTTALEHELLVGLGARPESVAHEFAVSNALDVIAARTHLRSACVLVGFEWAPCMLVQSSCAELCRFMARYPMATVRVTATRTSVALTATAEGVTELELERGRPHLTCLFENTRYRVRRGVKGDDFCFTFEVPDGDVGAAA